MAVKASGVGVGKRFGTAIFRSLKGKLILFFLMISLVPLTAVGVLVYVQAQDALKAEVANKLVALRDVKASQIEGYFDRSLDDVKALSNNPYTSDALNAMCLGCHVDAGKAGKSEAEAFEVYRSLYLGQPDLLDAKDESRYSVAHALYHPVFKEYMETYGYDDIFLVDLHHGKVVYSVTKKDEFGTHLTNVPYADTNLGNVYQQAMVTSSPDFTMLEDFAYFSNLDKSRGWLTTCANRPLVEEYWYGNRNLYHRAD